ncbi:hypothetical protein E2C01_093002 [Portunus trituberculatus]|uniref:Uncharacterized protein n=1 Tax=Portunus trituberculatus TaxID=210409 RepID=A0A5B7JX07_PORTR|nr:hypothetical protein [Portunus trituberculatus]
MAEGTLSQLQENCDASLTGGTTTSFTTALLRAAKAVASNSS